MSDREANKTEALRTESQASSVSAADLKRDLVRDAIASARANVDLTSIVAAAPEESAPRTEVSAATVGRMLGLASTRELKIVEGKIDLALSKINNITARIEKALSMMASAPSATDLERIDVQIGSLKVLIKETLTKQLASSPPDEKKS